MPWFELRNADGSVRDKRELPSQPPPVSGKGWTWHAVAAPVPVVLTPQQLADNLDSIQNSRTKEHLAIRAIINLMAAQLGVTKPQAYNAVKNEMAAIAATLPPVNGS